MSYTVQEIKTGDVITADMLNQMDEGVAANDAAITELQTAVSGNSTAIETNSTAITELQSTAETNASGVSANADAITALQTAVEAATDDEVSEMIEAVFA